MQTFLPWADFERSDKCLDYRRLGKQRVEARQIINALEGISTGWRNHPATRMWEGHVDALKEQFDCMSQEWVDRGYTHMMGFYLVRGPKIKPWWFVLPEFHRAHRSNLLRKNREFYQYQFESGLSIDLPYVWSEPR